MVAVEAPRKTLCFDLDGTLCSATARDYDQAEPFPWAIARVNRLAREGHTIIIMTARGAATGIDWEPVTRAQLERWGVTYHELRFGKPRADVFIDDRAVHSDAWRTQDAFTAPGFEPGGPPPKYPLPAPGHLTGVVEVGRTYNGSAVRLEQHAARAEALAIAAGIRDVPPAGAIEQAVAVSLPPDAGDVVYAIRISDPGGAAFLDAFDPERPRGLDVSCRPLAEAAAGLHPLLAPSAEPTLATTLELGRASCWPLRASGPSVRDALGGELGIVVDGHLILTEDSPMPTVAASWAEELAAALGSKVDRRGITPAELAGAEEAFVVSMPFCLLPIATLDGRAIGAGAPGPLARALLDAWSAAAGVDIAAQTTAALEALAEAPASL
ncbi:MAG: hypothetical protein ACJ77M_00660 [Thermoleophilaceae bacterium]